VPVNTLTTKGFAGEVQKIPLRSIRPNPKNPRGPIDKNENYFRLTSSINDYGVLVPIVVRQLSPAQGDIKYELVDGERRFWAARECAKETVPAHILSGSQSIGDLRKLMFHTHMTRENWTALAQCRALSEVYPRLAAGLRFSEKREWVKKLSKETVMQTATATDRIHFLSWPKSLKEKVYQFDATDDAKDIYSYVLAIEVSVVEQSRKVFPNYYNHNHEPEYAANKVRTSLLDKTLVGLETGAVSSREQIRSVSPLFEADLSAVQRRTALGLFKKFVTRPKFQFDDIRAEISAKLPEALKEKPPKPQRVIASLRSLERTMRNYDPSFVDDSVSRERDRMNLRREFIEALDDTAAAIKALRQKF
jgi:ParB/RepB/Spo0J family partition protein